ncbi:hypothetical protein F2P81_021036 [Scophthalmus maximus]|uniref:Uncharacterized protein n=1 Tax=Scophthalmus maximus TaxID=52904 RepID=A0A6A4S190_SCOMX|nr:hypothetical protein F2P81_021036 [Scophthalmus maximus]
MSGSGRIEFVLHPAVHLDQRTHICTDGRIQEFPPESVYDAHTAQKTESTVRRRLDSVPSTHPPCVCVCRTTEEQPDDRDGDVFDDEQSNICVDDLTSQRSVSAGLQSSMSEVQQAKTTK